MFSFWRTSETLTRSGVRKVNLNAEENRLTGVAVECDNYAVVVVEGVRKVLLQILIITPFS